MLAAVVLVSVVTGFAGIGVMQMLGFSFWASLLAYPVVGSVALIAAAAVASSGTGAAFTRRAAVPVTAGQTPRQP